MTEKSREKETMRKAFTLVELLVVIALFALISTILATILIRYNFFYQRQQIQIAAELDNRQILDDIATSVRQANNVVNNLTVNGNPYSGSAQVLILALSALDTSGQPLFGVSDYLLYYQDMTDEKLLRKIVTANSQSSRKNSDQILTANLKSINFSYNNSDPAAATVITAILETTKTEAGQTKEAKDKVQIRLRNL